MLGGRASLPSIPKAAALVPTGPVVRVPEARPRQNDKSQGLYQESACSFVASMGNILSIGILLAQLEAVGYLSNQ